MKREFLDYIEDIIEATKAALKFVTGIEYEDFKKDIKTSYAAIRALEVIGEAVKKIPDEVKDKYPQIPWRDISGMRDKLIHDYFGVELKVVWDTLKEDIPPLKSMFEKILKDYEGEK